MSINIERNIETVILLSALVINVSGIVWVARHNWKRYGLLALISGVLGSGICFIFVSLGYYTFPYLLVPGFMPFPFESILTAFSFYILLGVRYSPKEWIYKIVFYGIIVNPGVFAEFLLEYYTQIIKYDPTWDRWASYSAWWIFILFLEWIGERIIPASARSPIPKEDFYFARWAWFLFHGIVLLTTFGAGILVGMGLKK